ncbi:MAG: hypothetical protein ACPKPY_05495 [Nitrososphaeraceae archaeon]
MTSNNIIVYQVVEEINGVYHAFRPIWTFIDDIDSAYQKLTEEKNKCDCPNRQMRLTIKEYRQNQRHLDPFSDED